jgi:hypothetical protein
LFTVWLNIKTNYRDDWLKHFCRLLFISRKLFWLLIADWHQWKRIGKHLTLKLFWHSIIYFLTLFEHMHLTRDLKNTFEFYEAADIFWNGWKFFKSLFSFFLLFRMKFNGPCCSWTHRHRLSVVVQELYFLPLS